MSYQSINPQFNYPANAIFSQVVIFDEQPSTTQEPVDDVPHETLEPANTVINSPQEHNQ